jgi:hypothetical protein
MQTQRKIEEVYSQDEGVYHDAHVKLYDAQRLGIKVVFCDSNGIPTSDTLAPMASYLPNTAYNM